MLWICSIQQKRVSSILTPHKNKTKLEQSRCNPLRQTSKIQICAYSMMQVGQLYSKLGPHYQLKFLRQSIGFAPILTKQDDNSKTVYFVGSLKDISSLKHHFTFTKKQLKGQTKAKASVQAVQLYMLQTNIYSHRSYISLLLIVTYLEKKIRIPAYVIHELLRRGKCSRCICHENSKKSSELAPARK